MKFEIKGSIESNEKERTITHYITTPDLDWGNDIINPLGMHSEKYEKHRVVLYNHNETKPIGKNLWLKSKDSGNIALTYFSKKSDFANEVFELHKEGIINTWSVRWRPYEIDGQQSEKAIQYDSAKNIRYINEWELIEYSSAPLAMNYGAIDLLKGFKSEEMMEIVENLTFRKQVEELVENYKEEIKNIKKEFQELENKLAEEQKEIQEIRNKILKSAEILGNEKAKTIVNDIVYKVIAGEISRG